MRSTILLTIACSVSLGGCLAKQLRAPVAEHRVQTQVVANKCTEEGTFCEDAAITAKQACLIDAIVRGKDGSECAQ